MTTPQLLAMANGRNVGGAHRCFFCGAPCDESYPRDKHISDTFTGWGDVAFSRSRFICSGCVIATDEADRSLRPRMYSWIITASSALRYSKGKIPEIRQWCLAPPTPPFALVVAVSGQKHLLYRAPVNHVSGIVTAQVELEQVTYRPSELSARLSLAMEICAASGKPALAEPPTGGLIARLAQGGASIESIEKWFTVCAEPLSRLCAFICPPKEESQNERRNSNPNPIVDTGPAPDVRRPSVAAKTGGADGPGLFGR